MEGLFDSLRGKRVLITGSSRGIGKAMAIAFAQNGADVAVHCTGPCEAMDATLEELKPYGGKYIDVYGDLSDASVPADIYNKVEQAFGGVDILICNASLQINRSWKDITIEDFEIQMNINFRSVLQLIQEAVPGMQERKWGRVVTIGSVQQVKPHHQMLVYSASKSALVNMVRSLSIQLAPDGITVNNMAPGTIHTGRNEKVLQDDAYRQKVIDDIPVGFIGEPEDCSSIVLTLCSDSGRYITGEDIFVGGGKHI